MYLKLEIDGEESFYSFPDKNRVTVGRSPLNDIQVMVNGISRNHIEVHEKSGGNFYVIDKGSTHGTFINEEQLVKDKPVTFNTFFPARLAENVFIYLLDAPVEDTTQTVEIKKQDTEIKKSSLDDFFKEESKSFNSKNSKIYVPSTSNKMTKDMEDLMSKSKDLIPPPKSSSRSSRSPNGKGKKSNKKKVSQSDKNRKIFTGLMIFLAFVFVGYNQYQKIQMAKQKRALEEQKILEAQRQKEKEKQELIEKERLAKLREENLKKQKEIIKTFVNRDKCLSDLEILFCDLIGSSTPRLSKEGAIKELDTLYILLDVSHNDLKFNNYEYNDQELKTVMKNAKLTVGRNFHEGYFVNKMNSRLEEPARSEKTVNIKVLADFLTTLNDSFPDITDEIKKLTIIAIENDLYIGHVDYSIKKLKDFDFKKNKFNLIMYNRSNITFPLMNLVKELRFESNN